MDMDIEGLPPKLQFVFMAMMKSAISFKEMERDKEFFLNFAQEIWDSMEMSNFEELKEIIDGKMRQDIQPYVKSYMESLKK